MQCVDIMFTKLCGLQRLGRCCRSELKTATRTTDMLLLLVYAMLLELKTATRTTDMLLLLVYAIVVEIIGGVAFPGARATLIMRIFSLRSAFHSQIRKNLILA